MMIPQISEGPNRRKKSILQPEPAYTMAQDAISAPDLPNKPKMVRALPTTLDTASAIRVAHKTLRQSVLGRRPHNNRGQNQVHTRAGTTKSTWTSADTSPCVHSGPTSQ